MTSRVIVIGAGLSGLMSALALAEAGLRPLLLAKGYGTTHWTGGTIDLLASRRYPNMSLYTALTRLIADQPEHPYARMGLDGIAAAVDRFRTLTKAAGYPYVGGLDRNVVLPTALGALRPTALLPATMAAGDVRLGSEIVIAGFHELRDFFPPMAAANLQAQHIPARGVYLTLPDGYQRHDYSPRSFALWFEQPDFRQAIGQQLRTLRGTATRIGLPAVLGLRDPLGVVNDLQQISGAQIFEIPTLPPSIPGMRLMNIFQHAITAAGGRIQIGSEVRRGLGAEGILTHIFSEAAAREQQHHVAACVLATGGIAGGGISTDFHGTVRETALNLPLHAPDSRQAWFASRFLHTAGHPIFASGVPTDSQFRPLDHAGNVVYANVMVAGSTLLAGDPVEDRAVSGLALTTGWHVGSLLATSLQAQLATSG